MFLVELGGREPEKVFGGRVHIIGANHRFVFGGGKGQEGEAYRKGVVGSDGDALASFAIEGTRRRVAGDEGGEGKSTIWIKVVDIVMGPLPLVK